MLLARWQDAPRIYVDGLHSRRPARCALFGGDAVAFVVPLAEPQLVRLVSDCMKIERAFAGKLIRVYK